MNINGLKRNLIYKMSNKSLTSPSDMKVKELKYNLCQKSLSEDEVSNAFDSNIKTFPKLEKFWADPPYQGQNFTIISFVPSKGAIPDKNGYFGMCKVRGAFQNDTELNQHSEYIIRNVDSYHTLYHAKMGNPFPLATNERMEGLCKEIDQVRVNKEAQDIISTDVRQKRRAEIEDMKEAKRREKEITKIKDSVDPMHDYITLHVKRAQLIQNTIEQMHAIRENKQNLLKVMDELKQADEADPSYFNRYYDQYLESCEAVGIESKNNALAPRMKADIPFDFTGMDSELPSKSSIDVVKGPIHTIKETDEKSDDEDNHEDNHEDNDVDQMSKSISGFM
jgi:hypothetical protein